MGKKWVLCEVALACHPRQGRDLVFCLEPRAPPYHQWECKSEALQWRQAPLPPNGNARVKSETAKGTDSHSRQPWSKMYRRRHYSTAQEPRTKNRFGGDIYAPALFLHSPGIKPAHPELPF